MFRNYIYIIFLVFLFHLKNEAQQYIPMLNSHAEWHVTNCNSGCATDKYYTNGDTLINNVQYTFLDKYHYNKNFVLREDIAGKKIYLRLLADMPPVKDYLLYDFSLNVNDTISITNPGSPYPKYPGSFVLDSIVPKMLVNNIHRFFYLHALDSTTANTTRTIWVEGIGSLCLINTPGAMPNLNGVGALSCFFSNHQNEYSNLDSISDCTPIYPTSIKENSETAFYISQNFDSNSIKIFTKSQLNYNIIIYNIEGKQCFDKNNLYGNQELYLNDFKQGVYFLRIDIGNFYTKKFKLLIN